MIKKNFTAITTLIFCALLIATASVYALNSATSVSLVSTDSSGTQANAVTGNAPAMSADGRFVAFTSSATNLVAGDTNGVDDTFVKDTVSGITTRVSTDSVGAQSNGASTGSPDISDDGRYVVINSNATNLVAGDTNGFSDVFVKDTVTGTIIRVSTDSVGAQSNNSSFSFWTSISANGRYVAYLSVATNLVAGDTNGFFDIFVKDTISGTTTRVSTDSVGAQSNNSSAFPTISDDGRYVSFDSTATNLVASDTNGVGDVFIKDTQTGATTRASTDDTGVQGSAVSLVSVISSDGRYVAFRSDATNLVLNDTNGFRDHFVKDNVSGVIARVSTDSTGANGNAAIAGGIAMSADKRYIGFDSSASNLVAVDLNATADIFFRQNPFVLFPNNDNFVASPVIAGGTTPSVITNDLSNGSSANAADYVLSISNNGGLAGLSINPDGTLAVPNNATVGTFNITYQACETVSPTTCFTATATFAVAGLAETGVNLFASLIAGLLMTLAIFVFRRRSTYSSR